MHYRKVPACFSDSSAGCRHLPYIAVEQSGACRPSRLRTTAFTFRTVSHGTQTEVIDTTTDKLVATIPDTKGVYGIAVANDPGKGFTSNGTTNDVTIFDLKTSKATGNVKDGRESGRNHL